MGRRFLHLLSMAGLILLGATTSAAAATNVDVRGDWAEQSHYGGTSSYVMHWTTEDFSSGAVSGTGGQPGNDQWSMTGTITGNHLVYTLTYYGGGYHSTEDVTVAADGNSYSGTFSDSNGTTGTITASRTSGPPGLHPTSTAVQCHYSLATGDDTCTSTVGDGSTTATPTTPTGSVHYTSAYGGVFSAGDTCSLVASASSPSVATCSVVYIPPTNDTRAPLITASYGGDASHAASSGQTQFQLPGVTDPCASGGAVAAVAVAHVAPLPEKPVYCRYRLRYTAAEKDAAKQYRRAYEDNKKESDAGAIFSGGLAVGSALLPNATVSKVGTVVFGLESIAFGGLSWLDQNDINTMVRIQEDPQDPAWRTKASPPHRKRLVIAWPAGVPSRDRANVTAYLDAVLRYGADFVCIAQAIDRNSAAVANKSVKYAVSQARAGAGCASDAARIAPKLPSLAHRARAVLSNLQGKIGTRRLASVTERAAHKLNNSNQRAAIIGRVVARLKRLVPLSRSDIAALRNGLMNASARKLVQPDQLLGALTRSARQDARLAPYLRHLAAHFKRTAAGHN